MKITFSDVRWRFKEDERDLLDALNVSKNNIVGDIIDITLDFALNELVVHGTDNNFGCSFYKFNHITTGLERTSILFVANSVNVGEMAIFPNGRVAVVVDIHTKAPDFAINKQRLYCYVGG